MCRLHVWLALALCACAGPPANREVRERPLLETPQPLESTDPIPLPEYATGYVPGPRTLGLLEVLRIADDQGLDIQIAREHVAAARAERAIARAAWYPELAVGTSYFRNEGNVQATAGQFLDVDKQNTFLGAGLSLRLDLAAAALGEDAARERLTAAGHALESSAQDTQALAAELYLDLMEAGLQLSITEEAIAHGQSLVDLQEARSAGGSGLPADLSRSRAHLARAEGARVEAVRRVEVASAGLGELLQLPPTVQITPAGLAPLPDGESGTLEDLLFSAAQSRPELADARARSRAARFDARAASKAWLYPTLELGAVAGGFGNNFGDLESSEVYVAGLTWHLGARLFGVADRERAQYRAAQLTEVRLGRLVAAQVVAAEASLRAAAARLITVQDEITAADQAWILARDRHEAGAGLFVEVLEAQVALLRARISEAAADVDLHRSWYALQRAVGGL
ncbi:MAG: TolC family protein [Planctomycetota bacterium]